MKPAFMTEFISKVICLAALQVMPACMAFTSVCNLEQAAYIVLVALIRHKALFGIAGSCRFVIALSWMLV